jgi:hypothetical protein
MNSTSTTACGIGKLPEHLKQKFIQHGWLGYLRYAHTVTFFNSQFGSQIKGQFGLLFCDPNHPILNGVQCKVINPDAPLLLSLNDSVPRVLVLRSKFNPFDHDGLTIVVNNAEVDGITFLKTYPNVAILFTNVEWG